MKILVLYEYVDSNNANKEDFVNFLHDPLEEEKKHEVHKKHIRLHDETEDSINEQIDSIKEYLDSHVREPYDLILGPETSSLVERIIKQGINRQIPLITINATSTSLIELDSEFSEYHRLGIDNEARVHLILKQINEIYDDGDKNIYIFSKQEEKFTNKNTLRQHESYDNLETNGAHQSLSELEKTKVEEDSDKCLNETSRENSEDTARELEHPTNEFKTALEKGQKINTYSKNLKDEIIRQLVTEQKESFKEYVFHNIFFKVNIERLNFKSIGDKERKIVTHIDIINDLPINPTFPIIVCANSLETVALVKHLRDRGNSNRIFGFGSNQKMIKRIMENNSFLVTDLKDGEDINNERWEMIANELVKHLNDEQPETHFDSDLFLKKFEQYGHEYLKESEKKND